MINTRYPTLELLNENGPILTAIKTPEGYILIDQYEDLTIPSILNDEEFVRFTQDNGCVANSKGEFLIYKAWPDHTRPSADKIIKFIEEGLS